MKQGLQMGQHIFLDLIFFSWALNFWMWRCCEKQNSEWMKWEAGQRRSMFIQTQSTPNPDSLMFQPGRPVMEIGSSDFPSARSAMQSPLAKALFSVDGTCNLSSSHLGEVHFIFFFFFSSIVLLLVANQLQASLRKIGVQSRPMHQKAPIKSLLGG